MLSSASDIAPIRLKKNEERRLRAGHLWVYSNEVDTAATPLRSFEPGAAVEIQAHNGKFLGTGYVNPNSLICARLASRDPAHPLGQALLVHRFKVALSLRERIYHQPFYRLIYGEADGVPGLIVDRYDDVCVVQITTAGMERLKIDIQAALEKVLRPAGLLWRNDSPARALEGLESYVEVGAGLIPDVLAVEEEGIRFQIPSLNGQKTGWFFDQRDNRTRLWKYVEDRRVLDVFSYMGAWGIQAASKGAKEVVCLDVSTKALEYAEANARLNGVGERVSFVRGDAFQFLRELRESRERFDIVILDPPAFIKRKKDLREGMQAYRRLNEQAMRVLERDGLLVTCSCSYHFSRDELVRMLLRSARHLDRSLQILEHGRQGPDHPVHPAIPESEYLKAVFCRLLPA